MSVEVSIRGATMFALMGPRYGKSLARVTLAIVIALICALSLGRAHADPPPVTVFAAASLTDVLSEAGEAFGQRTGVVVRHSFAASGQLARQIEAGAAAELVVTADREWLNYLAARRLIRPQSVRSLASNRLVVIAPANSATRLDPRRATDWSRALGRGRWVSGDPAFVPLGRYAQASLTQLGVWNRLEPSLARAENARSALALVARGEAAFGVVYRTDARSDARVRVLATLPAESHQPIEYPAAATPRASTAALRYLEFLAGPEGQRIFARQGY